MWGPPSPFQRAAPPPNKTLSQPFCSAKARADRHAHIYTQFKSPEVEPSVQSDTVEMRKDPFQCHTSSWVSTARVSRVCWFIKAAAFNNLARRESTEPENFLMSLFWGQVSPRGETPKTNMGWSIQRRLNASCQALRDNNAMFWGLDVNLGHSILSSLPSPSMDFF